MLLRVNVYFCLPFTLRVVVAMGWIYSMPILKMTMYICKYEDFICLTQNIFPECYTNRRFVVEFMPTGTIIDLSK